MAEKELWVTEDHGRDSGIAGTARDDGRHGNWRASELLERTENYGEYRELWVRKEW